MTTTMTVAPVGVSIGANQTSKGFYLYGGMILNQPWSGITTGAELRMTNTRGGAQTVANDELGTIKFTGVDTAWGNFTAGNINTVATSVTPGAVSSTMALQTMAAGTLANRITIKGSSVGVSTSNPNAAYALDVLGTSQISSSASGGVPATVLLLTNPGNPSTGGGVTVSFQGGPGENTLGHMKMLYEQNSTAYSAMTFETSSNYVKSEQMRITSAGSIGIGTTSPDSKLHVNGSGAGGGLCVTSDDACASVPSGGQISAETTLNTGADYAEYFLSEESLVSGDIVGLNPSTGLARAYRAGDRLLGLVSTQPGVVGNSRLQKENSVLVALVGQVPFDRSQTQIRNNVAFTSDGKQIGYLLASGDLYVNIGSQDHTQALEALKAENHQLKSYLCSKDPGAPFCESQ
jgi:hypothetical protein